MYRATLGSNETATRDGIFSQATPVQRYGSSQRDYADGALGALWRGKLPRYARMPQAVRAMPIKGIGVLDKPPFNPLAPRAITSIVTATRGQKTRRPVVAGYGYAYGDDAAPPAAPAPAPASTNWPLIIGGGAAVVVVGALLLRKKK